ncbi:MAG: SusD/RagB family nutrient-binding outer membrane lipoprotein [Saprospiraceae bacterium]
MKFNYKILVSIALLFVMSSCGDMFDLDINVDPNNPTQASNNLLLTQSQYTLLNNLAGGVNNNQMGFMGILASGDNWNLGQSSYNDFWSNMYTGPLKDIDGLIAANSSQTGSPQYLGIAQLLKAYAYATLVDLFGDVPFSEAVKGDATDKILNAKFDDDAAVYAECFKLIDEGIKNVNSTFRPVPVTGDLIYNGNTDRWAKFGKSLRMKMLLNTRLVNTNAKAEIQALIDENKMIAADAEDFTFQFSKTFSSAFDPRHPWYSNSYTGPNRFTYILHQPIVEMLVDKDPRMSYYFRRQTRAVLDQSNPSDRNTTPCSQVAACQYGYLVLNGTLHQQLYGSTTLTTAQKDYLAGLFGRDRADPSGVPLDGGFRTMPGVYPAGGFFDVTAPGASTTGNANTAPGGGIFPALTSVNVLYYQIEAILTLGVTGDARALFEKAMRDHIRKVVDFGARTDANSTRPPYTRPDGVQVDVDSYVNLWLKRYDDAPSTEAKINVVLKQLWFSSWGNGYDIYNAFRRTGFPNTTQVGILTPRKFPLRLPYPQDELTVNTSATAYKDVIYDRDPIFWDK